MLCDFRRLSVCYPCKTLLEFFKRYKAMTLRRCCSPRELWREKEKKKKKETLCEPVELFV